MPDVIPRFELGLVEAILLAILTNLLVYVKILCPIIYISNSDKILANLCQYLYSGAALFKLICLDSTTKSVLYLKYPSMNPLDFVAEKVHTC